MSDEFSRYAQSRWTRLVHFGLLLGCEVHDAEDMAQSTLLKCFAQWDKVSAAMDTDAYVYKMLINEWRSRGRGDGSARSFLDIYRTERQSNWIAKAFSGSISSLL